MKRNYVVCKTCPHYHTWKGKSGTEYSLCLVEARMKGEEEVPYEDREIPGGCNLTLEHVVTVQE